MDSMVIYERPDGKVCPGYYSEPKGDNRAPAIVVIQEWWGLNNQIRGVANRLVSAGYRVLIPDLYRGRVTIDAKEAEHYMGDLNFADAATQDIQGAVDYLKQTSERVGVTGFCMGGALTILSAVHVSDIRAAVSWYGYPPLEYVDATKVKCHVMGHWALNDAFFPISGVDALEEKLKAAGVSYEFHRYPAQHAFANETQVNSPLPVAYNEDAAGVAWTRTMLFFGKRLKQYWT